MNDREEWRERIRDIRASGTTWWWWWWWYVYIYITETDSCISLSLSLSLTHTHAYTHIYYPPLLVINPCQVLLTASSVSTELRNIFADWPTLICPSIGVHKRKSLISSSLFLQLCPAYLARLDGLGDGR